MTAEDQPYFRFYPAAYSHRAFKGSTQSCDICALPCVWKYTGCIYTAGKKPTVCARCIANGRLEAFLGKDFQLHDIDLDNADLALEDEVLRRTPGVSCFNPFGWPVLDGKPLAFLGYGEDKALLREPEVEQAIREAFDTMGWDYDGPSPYALVFKEIDGPEYRAVIDLD